MTWQQEIDIAVDLERKRAEAEKAREIAKALKGMDVPVEKIAAASKLSIAEIEAL